MKQIKKFILKYGIGEVENAIEEIRKENRKKFKGEFEKLQKIANIQYQSIKPECNKIKK